MIFRRTHAQFSILVLFALSIYGCTTALVKVPSDAASDPAPKITLNAFATGGAGDVDSANVSATGTIKVSKNMPLIFSGGASSPGGVKTLKISVSQNGKVMFSAAATNAPDTNGNVPTTLSVPGTNGAGGVGSTPMGLTMSSPVVVTATSTNFHDTPTTVVATYAPQDLQIDLSTDRPAIIIDGFATLTWNVRYWVPGTTLTVNPSFGKAFDPMPLSGHNQVYPQFNTNYVFTATSPSSTTNATITITLIPLPTAKLSASPDNGYVCVGKPATLTWSTTNCPPQCNVSIIGQDGPNYSHNVFLASNLAPNGQLPVRTTQTNTQFTMRVSNQVESGLTAQANVTLTNNCGPQPTLTWFYFKMTNPDPNAVTPCFTLQIPGTSEATAKQAAENQNGGYTATQITAQQYYDGC